MVPAAAVKVNVAWSASMTEVSAPERLLRLSVAGTPRIRGASSLVLASKVIELTSSNAPSMPMVSVPALTTTSPAKLSWDPIVRLPSPAFSKVPVPVMSPVTLSPKVSCTRTVPFARAVVTALSVMELAVRETILAPAGMPVPLTVWPTAKPTVLLMLMSELKTVWLPVALETVSR